MEMHRKRSRGSDEKLGVIKDSTSSGSSEDERKTKKPKEKRYSKKKDRKRKSSKESSRHKKRKKKTKEGEKRRDMSSLDNDTSTRSCRDFISSTTVNPSTSVPGPSLPMGFRRISEESSSEEKKRSFAPMTQEEYAKMRNTVRRVTDPETGRSRLIKGEGEVLEEIVSRERHKEINKMATKGDGAWFQQNLKRFL